MTNQSVGKYIFAIMSDAAKAEFEAEKERQTPESREAVRQNTNFTVSDEEMRDDPVFILRAANYRKNEPRIACVKDAIYAKRLTHALEEFQPEGDKHHRGALLYLGHL